MSIDQKSNLRGYVGIGGQIFPVKVYDETGAAYDLTGLTVTVSGKIGGTDCFRDLACTLNADPTTGRLTFAPSAGEMGTAGVIDCQVQVDNGGAIALSTEFQITNRDPI